MLILIFICAFRSGSDRYYMKKAVGIPAGAAEVFHYIKPSGIVKLLPFYFWYCLLKAGILLFSFAPFILCLWVTGAFISGKEASAALFLVLCLTAVTLMLHGAVFFFRFNSFLFVARYCFASMRFRRMRELFIFSYRCMQGNRATVFARRLSFVPWFMSCVFLIPISFVRSYYNGTMATLAADLIEKHLQRQ